jgi:hypothetical protein
MSKNGKKISVSRLKEHFKTLPPGEIIYSLEHQTEEQKECCKQLIRALQDTPAIPLYSGSPPLI